MKKRLIATLGIAIGLTAGGTVLAAAPASADPPSGCPMLETDHGNAQWFDNASDQSVNSRLLACKRHGGPHV